MFKADFLIIGGGVIGLTLALELKRRFSDCVVALIDKEPDFGRHASGRNSGVLHAGFYYTADSLKARFTRDGNQRWTAFCRERGLAINPTGKIVVARNDAERDGIKTLFERGRANGVALELLSETDLAKFESHAKTTANALFSPTTSTVDPNEIIRELVADAQAAGIRLHTNTAYVGRTSAGVQTSGGTIQTGYVVNAAGLYADTVARDFGYSQDYEILPFKGLYLYSNAPAPLLKRHIYPVPDLRNPFLGTHFTVAVDGKVKVGPTAVPTLGRENYGDTRAPQWRELGQIAQAIGSLLLKNRFGFKHLAVQELPKNLRWYLAREAGKLVSGLDMGQFRIWGRPGIRAQPVNLRTRKLEMDFLYEGDGESFHVLNAVSPAFTCALPFSEHLADQITQKLSTRSSANNGNCVVGTAHGTDMSVSSESAK